MKKVLIAGGLCGTTMLVAAQKIEQRCADRQIPARISVHNLWEGGSISDRGFSVIVEMFPYFEDAACPLLSGKPFITHTGEDALIEQIVALLEADKEGD